MHFHPAWPSVSHQEGRMVPTHRPHCGRGAAPARAGNTSAPPGLTRSGPVSSIATATSRTSQSSAAALHSISCLHPGPAKTLPLSASLGKAMASGAIPHRAHIRNCHLSAASRSWPVLLLLLPCTYATMGRWQPSWVSHLLWPHPEFPLPTQGWGCREGKPV